MKLLINAGDRILEPTGPEVADELWACVPVPVAHLGVAVGVASMQVLTRCMNEA